MSNVFEAVIDVNVVYGIVKEIGISVQEHRLREVNRKASSGGFTGVLGSVESLAGGSVIVLSTGSRSHSADINIGRIRLEPAISGGPQQLSVRLVPGSVDSEENFVTSVFERDLTNNLAHVKRNGISNVGARDRNVGFARCSGKTLRREILSVSSVHLLNGSITGGRVLSLLFVLDHIGKEFVAHWAHVPSTLRPVLGSPSNGSSHGRSQIAGRISISWRPGVEVSRMSVQATEAGEVLAVSSTTSEAATGVGHVGDSMGAIETGAVLYTYGVRIPFNESSLVGSFSPGGSARSHGDRKTCSDGAKFGLALVSSEGCSI
mmetsp:Transcript_2709/g.4958  ORF Transcript_2709/g.4958 Transcript_2709/m.4958 type:complete len:319 (+) Transcript_2709:745-1701(+)